MRTRFVDSAINLVSATLLLILSGCIAFPVAPPPGEKPFTGDYMSAITVGETTRQQVRKYLEDAPSAPTLTRFDDESTWVYHATRATWQWLVCAGGGYYADCGMVGGQRDHFLIFEFAGDDTVDAWETVSTLDSCAGRRVCVRGESIMIYADETRDRHVKTSDIASECRVFVYPTFSWGSAEHFVKVWLDDELLGWFVEDDAFMFAATQPGPHIVRTMQGSPIFDDIASGMHSQYLAFDCAAGDSIYLHHDSHHPDANGRRFLLVREEAAAPLTARRLILQPVDEPQSQQTDLPVSESLVDNSSGIVWEVQAKLRKLGFYDGDMDGELSDETVTAIRTYKLDRKLPGDTLLDDNTLAALGFYGD